MPSADVFAGGVRPTTRGRVGVSQASNASATKGEITTSAGTTYSRSKALEDLGGSAKKAAPSTPAQAGSQAPGISLSSVLGKANEKATAAARGGRRSSHVLAAQKGGTDSDVTPEPRAASNAALARPQPRLASKAPVAFGPRPVTAGGKLAGDSAHTIPGDRSLGSSQVGDGDRGAVRGAAAAGARPPSKSEEGRRRRRSSLAVPAGADVIQALAEDGLAGLRPFEVPKSRRASAALPASALKDAGAAAVGARADSTAVRGGRARRATFAVPDDARRAEEEELKDFAAQMVERRDETKSFTVLESRPSLPFKTISGGGTDLKLRVQAALARPDTAVAQERLHASGLSSDAAGSECERERVAKGAGGKMGVIDMLKGMRQRGIEKRAAAIRAADTPAETQSREEKIRWVSDVAADAHADAARRAALQSDDVAGTAKQQPAAPSLGTGPEVALGSGAGSYKVKGAHFKTACKRKIYLADVAGLALLWAEAASRYGMQGHVLRQDLMKVANQLGPLGLNMTGEGVLTTMTERMSRLSKKRPTTTLMEMIECAFPFAQPDEMTLVMGEAISSGEQVPGGLTPMEHKTLLRLLSILGGKGGVVPFRLGIFSMAVNGVDSVNQNVLTRRLAALGERHPGGLLRIEGIADWWCNINRLAEQPVTFDQLEDFCRPGSTMCAKVLARMAELAPEAGHSKELVSLRKAAKDENMIAKQLRDLNNPGYVPQKSAI
ncbi:unnamed protein product [Pedinophyceae sp. YPF-701]|nr:unnamed protein product [Pedinophyceae sp. YPF-701]